MTITLNIPPETEAKLQQKALLRGVTLSELMEQLAVSAADEEPRRPTTGAELVAQWEAEGVYGAWADRDDIGDGVEYAQSLRQRAQQRDWTE